jgi:hypothetical protein
MLYYTTLHYTILFSVILVAAAIGNFGAIQAEIKAEKDR